MWRSDEMRKVVVGRRPQPPYHLYRISRRKAPSPRCPPNNQPPALLHGWRRALTAADSRRIPPCIWSANRDRQTGPAGFTSVTLAALTGGQEDVSPSQALPASRARFGPQKRRAVLRFPDCCAHPQCYSLRVTLTTTIRRQRDVLKELDVLHSAANNYHQHPSTKHWPAPQAIPSVAPDYHPLGKA